nr:MAG TPA: hypothetical protein [Caudoviricetes sp.]
MWKIHYTYELRLIHLAFVYRKSPSWLQRLFQFVNQLPGIRYDFLEDLPCKLYATYLECPISYGHSTFVI